MGRRRADQSSLKREGEVLHVELLKGKVVWVVCVPLRALRIYNVAVGSSSLFSKCLLYSVVRFVMGVVVPLVILTIVFLFYFPY